jgi:hypothetical protein
MTVHDVGTRQAVVLPLWANATLDQLDAAERQQVVTALERFARDPHADDLPVTRLSPPAGEPSSGDGPGAQGLFVLRVSDTLRLLLLYRGETRQYEVVGLRRRPRA